ncbi:MAG: hypothetical protein JXR60_02145 [Bacteroidales bacterium]|nr:hypothetical protein [Bacteroidales bacterium]
MRHYKLISIVIVTMFISINACKTKESVAKENDQIQVERSTTSEQSSTSKIYSGTIHKQGITTYQYGSHVLKTDQGVFALRSKENLDAYIDKVVEITATEIKGYPVSGGPIYLEVISIKSID